MAKYSLLAIVATIAWISNVRIVQAVAGMTRAQAAITAAKCGDAVADRIRCLDANNTLIYSRTIQAEKNCYDVAGSACKATIDEEEKLLDCVMDQKTNETYISYMQSCEAMAFYSQLIDPNKANEKYTLRMIRPARTIFQKRGSEACFKDRQYQNCMDRLRHDIQENPIEDNHCDKPKNRERSLCPDPKKRDWHLYCPCVCEKIKEIELRCGNGEFFDVDCTYGPPCYA